MKIVFGDFLGKIRKFAKVRGSSGHFWLEKNFLGTRDQVLLASLSLSAGASVKKSSGSKKFAGVRSSANFFGPGWLSKRN